MEQFDLHWPNMDASFLTDGRRCRIVWRRAMGKRPMPAGSIDNNALCKARLAQNLTHTPKLLDELRFRGYLELAAEIASLVPDVVPDVAQHEEPAHVRVRRWLDALPGDGAWRQTDMRRGKSWLVVSRSRQELLELRMPAAKRRGEWVLKRRAADEGKLVGNKSANSTCIVAADLKGIFCWIVAAAGDGAGALLDELFAACVDVDHPAIVEARDAWHAG